MRGEHLAALKEFYAGLCRPPPRLSVAEWVEQNVVIPPGAESTSGGFSFHRVPYAREPLECYADRSVRELVLVFGTQCIKTTIMRLGAMYRICNDPIPCVWVLPNEKPMALSFAKSRWHPLLKESPATYARIPKTEKGFVDRTRFGFLEMLFPGMPINFVGSNSPANLASRSAGLIQMDEIDKYARETDFEPGALQNVEERAKNFPLHLIVKSSTPTTEGHGIWAQFIYTDQRHYYVPCPRCGARIVLRFRAQSEEHGECGLRWWRESPQESRGKDGKWDLDAVAANAHYKCQLCGKEVFDHEREGMIQNGVWRPHNPGAKSTRRGYHLSSLYSLVSAECSFSEIARKWCEKSGVTSERHRMINSTLAEPWNQSKAFDDATVQVSMYEPEAVMKREGKDDDKITIGTIDFQLNHFWVVFRTWQRPSPEHPHGQSWLVLADRIDTEEEIAVLQEKYGVPAEHMRLDVAKRMNAAGQILLRRRWRGLLGSTRKSYPHRLNNGIITNRVYSEIQWRDAHAGTKRESPSLANMFPFVYWCKDPIRDLLATLRDQQPTMWHIHSNAHPEYQRHLGAHVKMSRVVPRTGERIDYWMELSGRSDHLLDCEAMNAVTAVELGYAELFEEQGRLSIG